MEEEKKKQFEAEKKAVDIGYPVARLSRSEETKLKTEHRLNLKNNPEIERLSRHLKCEIDIWTYCSKNLTTEISFKLKNLCNL